MGEGLWKGSVMQEREGTTRRRGTLGKVAKRNKKTQRADDEYSGRKKHKKKRQWGWGGKPTRSFDCLLLKKG